MIDDFDAMQRILLEWQQVRRKTKLNQELYDHLMGSLLYMIRYARKNNISLPNMEALDRIVKRAHMLIDEVNVPTTIEHLQAPDETLQGRKPDGELTEPGKIVLL